MSKYRQFEIIAQEIYHGFRALTANQAIALVILESIPLQDPQEKLEISLVVCKLEYFRMSRLFDEKMGKHLYHLLYYLDSLDTKYQLILKIGAYLDQELFLRNRRINPQNYGKVTTTVSKYLQVPKEQFHKDIMALVEAKKPKPFVPPTQKEPVSRQKSQSIPKNTRKKRRFFPWTQKKK